MKFKKKLAMLAVAAALCIGGATMASCTSVDISDEANTYAAQALAGSSWKQVGTVTDNALLNPAEYASLSAIELTGKTLKREEAVTGTHDQAAINAHLQEALTQYQITLTDDELSMILSYVKNSQITEEKYSTEQVNSAIDKVLDPSGDFATKYPGSGSMVFSADAKLTTSDGQTYTTSNSGSEATFVNDANGETSTVNIDRFSSTLTTAQVTDENDHGIMKVYIQYQPEDDSTLAQKLAGHWKESFELSYVTINVVDTNEALDMSGTTFCSEDIGRISNVDILYNEDGTGVAYLLINGEQAQRNFTWKLSDTPANSLYSLTLSFENGVARVQTFDPDVMRIVSPRYYSSNGNPNVQVFMKADAQ